MYEALWHTLDGGRFRAWQMRRSRSRRWWRTEGAEWATLTHFKTYSVGYHITKALAGAIRGRAGTRTAYDRHARTRNCAICGTEADIYTCWRTPDEPGLTEEWCLTHTPEAVRNGHGGNREKR